jgi:hypothetical protein
MAQTVHIAVPLLGVLLVNVLVEHNRFRDMLENEVLVGPEKHQLQLFELHHGVQQVAQVQLALDHLARLELGEAYFAEDADVLALAEGVVEVDVVQKAEVKLCVFFELARLQDFLVDAEEEAVEFELQPKALDQLSWS